MMRRLMALLLAVMMMMAGSAAALAEEDDFAGDGLDDESIDDIGDPIDSEGPSEQEMNELEELDDIDENDDGHVAVVGGQYHETDIEELSNFAPALYTAKSVKALILYSDRSTDSKPVVQLKDSAKVEILYVGIMWCIARYNDTLGYIKRDKIAYVTPVDPVNTPPYGVQKSTYVATAKNNVHVRKSMSTQDDSWVVLNPGTMLSIWRVQDGWGIVPYMRHYGYIDMTELTDLITVSPTDDPLSADTPIAAYTSYYKMVQTEINKGRIINISVACQRLSRVMEPGEKLDFNKNVGPYRRSTGYQPAWVLVNGKSVKGYGGGTCQVSSTLYNALLQLPGITILQRRPHGPGGASYLPHGVDAAVGTNNLNLRFENDYDFPIRIEGHSSGDGALLMLVYRADDTVKASN